MCATPTGLEAKEQQIKVVSSLVAGGQGTLDIREVQIWVELVHQQTNLND